jgi:hypothetical protein
MIYIWCSIFLLLGIGIGYLLSRAEYARRCNNGWLIWKCAEGGWDGAPDAMEDITEWIISGNL